MLNWDPGTISLELEELLGHKLPAHALNRLMAAVEIVTSDGFYKDLPTFNRLCVALTHGVLLHDVFEPADALDIAWGITEAMLIWPPDRKDEKPFADQIVRYIGMVLDEEGIMLPPDVLRLGINDTSMWQQVQMAFSDDPGMFQMIYGAERDRTDEINAAVKARLSHVLTLLDSLPLQVGSAEGAVKQMFAALRKTEDAGSKMRPNV